MDIHFSSYDVTTLIQWTSKLTGTKETYLGISWEEKFEIEGVKENQSVGSFEFYLKNTSHGDNIMVVPPGGMHIEKGIGGFCSAQGVLEKISKDYNNILGLFLPNTGPHRNARTDVENRGYVLTGKGKHLSNRGIALFIHNSTINRFNAKLLDALGCE